MNCSERQAALTPGCWLPAGDLPLTTFRLANQLNRSSMNFGLNIMQSLPPADRPSSSASTHSLLPSQLSLSFRASTLFSVENLAVPTHASLPTEGFPQAALHGNCRKASRNCSISKVSLVIVVKRVTLKVKWYETQDYFSVGSYNCGYLSDSMFEARQRRT